MRNIEFGEEEMNDLQAVAQKLFADENDPASVNYRRKLVRPKINWVKIILSVSALMVFDVLIFFFLQKISFSIYLSLTICGLFSLSVLLVFAKKTVIGLIHIYQRYAPDSIRNKCRFEPSCSEYMILSIEKYGLIKGVRKGIKRLKRCNIHNGGYDYP